MASPSFPVIYLTGAPATGKSTLSRNLVERYPALKAFAYSEELRKMLAHRAESPLTEDGIRQLSAKIVTPEDIVALDRQLVDRVRSARMHGPFLIDSHPVTKEDYGFRVTGFDIATLKDLDPDLIVCLYTSAQTMIRRIEAAPMGRPAIQEFEAQMHTNLQTGVATQYGIILGKPVYLVDSSVPEDELASVVAAKARLAR